MSSSVDIPAHSAPSSRGTTPRRDAKSGAGRWIKAVAIATTAVAVASSAIAGTVAAQTGQLFGDVPRGHYAYDAVQWAVENGIAQGCGDGRNFCPEQTLNRAQMVTFLKRYHDNFGSSASDGSGRSDDSRDPEEHVMDGSGTDSESLSLSAGRYSVEFTVEHARDLDEVKLVVEDSGGRDETLVDLGSDDIGAGVTSHRGRYTIMVGTRLGQLDPGRIYFDVTVKDDGNTRSHLVEWEIIVSER